LFDTQVQANGEESYHLTREGGHSHRRILHAADATGKAVETTLVDKALAHPNIRILERSNAVDLIVSIRLASPARAGWSGRGSGIVIKSGGNLQRESRGAGHRRRREGLSIHHNPDVSSGDGIAMAWRAGCRVANLEFNQFHPTALYHPQARNFLLTKRCAAKAPTLNARTAPALCRTLTSAASWPRAISSPAPSIMR
jgi:L-aspartate oxidase